MDFNVDTAVAEQPPFTIDSGVAAAQPPSEEVARTRTAKAHMGLGDIIKQDYESIYNSIASGQENVLRENAALDINAKAMADKQHKLIQMAAEKGRNLTLQDVQSLDTPPADPKSVLEKSYARNYINSIDNAAARIEDTILDEAKAQNPEAVKEYMNRGSDVLSKREYAITAAQNRQADADKNAWFGFKDPFFGDQHNFGSYDLKQIASFGFYESVMLRGNTKEASRIGFLGNVMEAQAREILKLPFDEFQKEFDRIDKNLAASDPILAQQWAKAVSGMSSSEQGLYNATEVANVAMAGQAAAGIRVVRGAVAEGQVRNLGNLSAGADGTYRPTAPTMPPGGPGRGAGAVSQITSDDLGRGAMTVQEVLRGSPTPPVSPAVAQAARAVDDVLRSSSAPVITKATIAEGAGDIKEAAVQKAITSSERADPKANAIDTLLSISRSDKDALRNNPGNLSREGHTRLLDAADGFEKNTIDVLVNTSKVMRTPVLAEEGFRSVADKVKNYFPGRENTILDVEVQYNPIANVFDHHIKIGNYDGTAFSSYEQAANHARLNGYPINIEGRVGENLYLPPAAMKVFESVKTTPEGTKFYIDKGVEVVPSATPIPGHIPYNTKTGKFGDPVGNIIEQQGLGFHIIVTKPLNETESFIRDGLVTDPRAYSSSNKDANRFTQVANGIIGPIRNPYDSLSRVETENRAKATFGQSKFIDAIKQEIAVVEDIYKGMLGDKPWVVEKPLSYTRTVTGANKIVANDFSRALEASQTLPDPATGLPGYYMKTPAEIQHFWQATFGRPASFKEQAAYLAVGRADNFDHILRNVEEFKFKSRLGVEQWSFSISKDGKKESHPFFDAAQVKKVNHSTDEVTLIVDANGSEKYWHQMGTKAQTEFTEALQEGKYLGVEIYDPEKRPVKRTDIDGNPLRIRYVFSNAFERKPLSFDQIGYRGGGHWEYDYDHAVKQAIVRPQKVGGKFQHIYEGDTTFGFVSSRAEGEVFAKNMNEVSRLIRNRDIAGARAFVRSHFDIEWKEFYKGYRASKNPQTGELQPPRFSTDPRQEFRVVPKGRSIFDLDKDLENKFTKTHPKTGVVSSTFVNGTRHGSLARNFQVAYSQPRDSYALLEPVNTGTLDVPFYQFRPAKLLDPITTMTRAMNRIINSSYMNDMKISAVEHWLAENADLLDATIPEIRSSPFYYFREGKFKNNPDTLLRQSNAISNRYKINEFVGTPSFIDSVIHGVKQELSDARYVAKGDSTLKKIAKAPLIIPEWLLDRVHDPVDFGRSMTYHMTLGLFAIKQVVVQSMAYTTIFGISGARMATSGSFAAWMHQWLRINGKPQTVEFMDRTATLFGWRLGEFTEARKLLNKTGFGTVRNEMSLDTGNRKQTFFRNDLKGVLDAGQVPFNEGNLHVRFGAWYTAFREFRDKNPFLQIGPVQEGQILRRANILNVTMTRDANTIMNKGAFGVPFQFYDYMKKMADTFWGKNIGEPFPVLTQDADGVYRSNDKATGRSYVRARMFLLYAMLGGAAGATGVSGLPFGDIIRKKALEGNLPFQTEMYVPGANLASTILMEGTVSTMVAYLSGFGDPQKGTFYNFNNRFNPNGLQVLRDVIQTDPSFWKILTGAMGSTVANEIASLSGFTNAMYSMIEGNPGKEAWPLKLDDWIAPLDNISSWRDADRLYYAVAFGKWLDRHGRPVSDVGKIDAVFRTLTGLTDQRVDDMYLKTLNTKDRTAVYNRAFQEFEEQSIKAERAAAAGDTEQANDYNKRAFFALTSRDVPVELWDKALTRRANSSRDMIDKNNEGYYLRYVPTNKQQQAIEAFRKSQKDK